MFTNTSCNFLKPIALLLSSVGAINWGLIAAFNFNLVEFLLGHYPLIVKAIYGLVGLSGLYALCPVWKMSCSIKEKLS
jgi:hypothetical protein